MALQAVTGALDTAGRHLSRAGTIHHSLQNLNVRNEHGICHVLTYCRSQAPALGPCRSKAVLKSLPKVRQSVCQQPPIAGAKLRAGLVPTSGRCNWPPLPFCRTSPLFREAGSIDSVSGAGFASTVSSSAQTAACDGHIEVPGSASDADDAPYSSHDFQGVVNGGSPAPLQPGALYLVGTPIGNLEDISFR